MQYIIVIVNRCPFGSDANPLPTAGKKKCRDNVYIGMGIRYETASLRTCLFMRYDNEKADYYCARLMYLRAFYFSVLLRDNITILYIPIAGQRYVMCGHCV